MMTYSNFDTRNKFLCGCVYIYVCMRRYIWIKCVFVLAYCMHVFYVFMIVYMHTCIYMNVYVNVCARLCFQIDFLMFFSFSVHLFFF